MSEKRFTYGETIDYNFFDVFEEKKYLGMVQRDSTKIVDCLNEQSDTIEGLLLDRNRQEGKLDIARRNLSKQLEKIEELQKENEQLRKTMNEVIELLLEEVDLFSDKATEHDIIAYKEMNDFDNKDAYYMCISTKKAIKMLQRCF